MLLCFANTPYINVKFTIKRCCFLKKIYNFVVIKPEGSCQRLSIKKTYNNEKY